MQDGSDAIGKAIAQVGQIMTCDSGDEEIIYYNISMNIGHSKTNLETYGILYGKCITKRG
jgi:hypothetical protein